MDWRHNCVTDVSKRHSSIHSKERTGNDLVRQLERGGVNRTTPPNQGARFAYGEISAYQGFVCHLSFCGSFDQARSLWVGCVELARLIRALNLALRSRRLFTTSSHRSAYLTELRHDSWVVVLFDCDFLQCAALCLQHCTAHFSWTTHVSCLEVVQVHLAS